MGRSATNGESEEAAVIWESDASSAWSATSLRWFGSDGERLSVMVYNTSILAIVVSAFLF
jgi:hypothetical protein